MRLATLLPIGTLLLAPPLAAAAPSALVSRDKAPVPARFASPLPTSLDFRSASSTRRLSSHGLGRLPLHGTLSHRLCRGDPGVRSRFLEGLRAIHPDPEPGIREAYRQLTWGDLASPCAAPDFCRWLAARIDVEREAQVRDFLWIRVAQCWPLREPALFERPDAPEDAVVAFHTTRARTEAVHSPRLSEVVRRRFAARDADGLASALGAYARMDHPENARTLLALHGRNGPAEIDRAVVYAMRNQDDPEAQAIFGETCHREHTSRLESWREQRVSLRGHPNRFGDPCRRATAASWESALAKAPPQESARLPDRFAGIDGRVLHLIGTRPFQFSEEAGLLRRIADGLSPALDEVVFDESWPAVDAVALSRGPHAVNIWVNDDGVGVHVADRDGAPDLDQAEAIREELLAALPQPRRLDAYLAGRRLRFRFEPQGDEYDVEAAALVVNTLLDLVDDPRRVARVRKEGWLALLVATPRELERARADGLLLPSAPP